MSSGNPTRAALLELQAWATGDAYAPWGGAQPSAAAIEALSLDLSLNDTGHAGNVTAAGETA